MHKKLIGTLLLLLIVSNCFGQLRKPDELIDKWIKSVVNIECTQSNEKYITYVYRRYENKIIDSNLMVRLTDSLLKNQKSFFGTCIFLKYKSKYFLLTAKHVLNDTTAIFPNTIYNHIKLVENEAFLNTGTQKEQSFLVGNGIGPMETRPYEFSEKEDIGIISLSDGLNKGFLNVLLKRGYLPISLSNIDTNCLLKPGQKIVCIGYPTETVLYQRKGLDFKDKIWESSIISSPLVSYGFVNSSVKNESFFDGGIYIYYGYSGGPVISNNKLIGITSRREIEKITTNNVIPFIYYFQYKSIFVKTSLLMGLLKKIESKKLYYF